MQKNVITQRLGLQQKKELHSWRVAVYYRLLVNVVT